MRITGKAFSVFGMLLSVVGLGAQSQETVLKIEVHLYNYSGVTTRVLARAEQETARIYRRLGVEMKWRNGPHTKKLPQDTARDLPSTSTRFLLLLLSNEMARRYPMGDDIYGFALLPVPGDEGFGVVANVFADRARELAVDDHSHGVILGYLIAHELGHLLLGEAGHPAEAGIMHQPWKTRELDQIMRGEMFFSPKQAERIRAQVLARTIGEPSKRPWSSQPVISGPQVRKYSRMSPRPSGQCCFPF